MGDKIYGGTGSVGHLFVYDTQTGISQDLGRAIDGLPSITALVAHNGCLYGSAGGYNLDAQFFSYNPATRIFTNYGVVVPGEYYIKALTVGDNGVIYGGTQWSAGHFFAFDPLSHTYSDKGNPPNAGTQINALITGSDGTIYIASSSINLISYSPINDSFSNENDDNYFYNLVLGNDNRLYGNDWNENLWAFDLSSHQATNYGKTMWGMDVINALVRGIDGRIYGAGSQLFYFDPADHPYLTPGIAISVEVNPSIQSISMGNWVYPYAIVRGADGMLYIGSYDYLDYQFSRFNPQTGVLTPLGRPAPDDYITALAAASDGRIYLGTGSEGKFFVYNPATNQTILLGQPVSADPQITSLVEGTDGRIYGGTTYTEGHLFIYNPAHNSFIDKGTVGDYEWGITALAASQDGNIYMAGRRTGSLYRYAIASNRITLAAVPSGWNTVDSLEFSSDGTLFIGCDSNGNENQGHVFAYLPVNGSLLDLGQPVDNTGAVISLVRSGSRIYGLARQTGLSQQGHILFYYQTGSYQPQVIGNLAPGSWLQKLAAAVDGRIFSMEGYQAIYFDPAFRFSWDKVTYLVNQPAGTTLKVDVLDVNNRLLAGNISSGRSLANLDSQQYPLVRLRATLSTSDPAVTPSLDRWSVSWSLLQLAPRNLAFWMHPEDADQASRTVQIDKVTNNTLTWTALADQPWLAVAPAGGAAPGTLSVQVNKDGMAEDTFYSGNVTVNWNSGTYSGTETIPVLLYIGSFHNAYLPAIGK